MPWALGTVWAGGAEVGIDAGLDAAISFAPAGSILPLALAQLRPGGTLAGAQLTDIMFWVPQSGRMGLGTSILSYNDKVYLGVVTDVGLVPDPERIIEGFHQEYEALMELVRLAQTLETPPAES